MDPSWTESYLEISDATTIPVSSVAGFSRASNVQSRTLRELLSAVKSSNLELFRASDLEHGGKLGEGTSYKVTQQTMKHTGKVYAMKEVKIPADLTSFQRQITCVMRDVEIMSRLADSENILNIFGYGWNVQRGSYIPFIMTEYASYGTLREFLRNTSATVPEKLLLCRDVAQALHSLHTCSIAHGDLKLENVLVTPANSDTDRELEVTARLSDFGHSLPFGEDDEENTSRYGGTLAYNAPEITFPQFRRVGKINFRKSDMWSLGLLCWETLDDGNHYYRNSKSYAAIVSSLRSQTLSSPANNNQSGSFSPNETTNMILKQDMSLAAPFLAGIACKDLSSLVGEQLSPRELDRLCSIFQKCLQAESEHRVDNVVDLPLLPKSKNVDVPSLHENAHKITSVDNWSFDVFNTAHSIPHAAKAQLLSEYMSMAHQRGPSYVSARAAFQAAFAHIENFGTVFDIRQACHWLSVSVSKGLPLESAVLCRIERLLCHLATDSQVDASSELNEWDVLDFVKESFQKQISDKIPAWHLPNVSMEDHTMPKIMTTTSNPNYLVSNRETLLQLAFHSGQYEHVKLLLKQGNDPWCLDSRGCGPFHWLFMFPEQEFKDVTEALLCCEERGTPARSLLNSMATTEAYVDHQLPLRLAGTPLAFATAARSHHVIKFLLSLGADPIRGQNHPVVDVDDTDDSMRTTMEHSALHIACKYHITKALKLFFWEALAWTIPRLRRRTLSDMLHFCTHTFCSSSRSERLLQHGLQTYEAAKDGARFLLTLLSNIYPQDDYIFIMLEPAVQNGNIDIGLRILEVVEESDGGRFRSQLNPTECEKLLWLCIEKACSRTLHPALVTQILQLAVKAGADVNGQSSGERTQRPINDAIQHCDRLVFDWFLSQGADLNAQDSRGYSPLHHMVSAGFDAVYSLTDAVKHGASTRLRNLKGMDPLELAIEENKVGAARALMQGEVNSGLNPRYQQLLHFATNSQQPTPDIIAAILDGADRDQAITSKALWHILKEACLFGWTEIISMLLTRGVPIKAPDTEPDLPGLLVAAQTGHFEAVQVLLDAGADPNYIPPDLNTTTLEWVLQQRAENLAGVYESVQLLAEAGAIVTFRHLELTVAKPRFNGWEKFATYLLNNGADPLDQRGKWICDALRDQHYDVDLAAFLVESGASFNNESGQDITLNLLASMPPPADAAQHIQTALYFLAKKAIANGGQIFMPHGGEAATPLVTAVLSKNRPVHSALLEEHKKLAHQDFKRLHPKASVWRKFWHVFETDEEQGYNTALLRYCWDICIISKYWEGVLGFLKLGLSGSTRIFDKTLARQFLQWALNPLDGGSDTTEIPEALAFIFGTGDMRPPEVRLPKMNRYLAKLSEGNTFPIGSKEQSLLSEIQAEGCYFPPHVRRSRTVKYEATPVFVGMDYGTNPPPPGQISILFEDEDADMQERLKSLGSFHIGEDGLRSAEKDEQADRQDNEPVAIVEECESCFRRYRGIVSYYYRLEPSEREKLFLKRSLFGSKQYLIENWDDIPLGDDPAKALRKAFWGGEAKGDEVEGES